MRVWSLWCVVCVCVVCVYLWLFYYNKVGGGATGHAWCSGEDKELVLFSASCGGLKASWDYSQSSLHHVFTCKYVCMYVCGAGGVGGWVGGRAPCSPDSSSCLQR